MLQQTQVSRVLPKYESWLASFPDIETLAGAPLAEVLRLWSGLGYNRRGKWLKEAAMAIRDKHGGRVPENPEDLDALPGLGEYSSKAVATFAFGRPEVFIETNIRRVFIHFFFQEREEGNKVLDREILPLIAQSLDRDDPRHWYYALMDYGATLPKYLRNPNRKSAQYTIQSPLRGSNREARGAILRSLACGRRSTEDLVAESGIEARRIAKAMEGLVAEGLVSALDGAWCISEETDIR